MVVFGNKLQNQKVKPIGKQQKLCNKRTLSQFPLTYSTIPLQDSKHISRAENTIYVTAPISSTTLQTNGADCICDEQDANVSSKVFSLQKTKTYQHPHWS